MKEDYRRPYVCTVERSGVNRRKYFAFLSRTGTKAASIKGQGQTAPLVCVRDGQFDSVTQHANTIQPVTIVPSRNLTN